MNGENHGTPFNRCNLCGDDLPKREPYTGNYCMKCTEGCLNDASELLDKLSMAYDPDLAYECMEKILEGRK